MASLAPHCQTLMEAKQASGKTFAEIAAAIGKPEVWTAALFFGNAVTDAETAAKIATEIGLKDEVAVKGLAGKGPGSLGVDGMIVRGQNWEWPPKDPVLYRLYEVLVVYGYSYKALIYEKFGDGIMSAIGFRTSVERKADPKGDRVVITLDGKFLPYSSPEEW
ncbi:Cyanate hydratase [Apiotrichum porosum]|uniref:Cyanate hydratase n=1 Tax=Apiotrichum porosum TaxID=105984 RepID=A0A427XJZ6_9TREE|nr:Cyanate hydratase [Apiotrichum porosum]RSH79113.1 Cyanate hydratase [Apiotrichum porosum]